MATDPRVKDVGEIETTHLFDMVVDLHPRQDMGEGPRGRRVHFGSAGGTFEGPRLRGDVLPGGGDWAVFRPDGVMVLDVRLTLRTHDGQLLYMTYGGRWVTPPHLRADLAEPAKRHQVDPESYYFHTNPLFETGAHQYTWLNDIVCVGTGYVVEGGVAYKVSAIV